MKCYGHIPNAETVIAPKVSQIDAGAESSALRWGRMCETLLSSPSAIAAPWAGIEERGHQGQLGFTSGREAGEPGASHVLLLQLDKPQATFLLRAPAFAAQLSQSVDVPLHSMCLAGSPIRGFY